VVPTDRSWFGHKTMCFFTGFLISRPVIPLFYSKDSGMRASRPLFGQTCL
jgi:hypothetical protein